jgi:hypothetical protein
MCPLGDPRFLGHGHHNFREIHRAFYWENRQILRCPLRIFLILMRILFFVDTTRAATARMAKLATLVDSERL